MKKIFLSFLILIFALPNLRADEGMWIPLLIKERIADMQKNGFKLTAEDVYSINQACLKDAIVHFGGGCTGELISDMGLLITNHHCGFSQIQAHSTVEHDYLRDGFWAKTMADELPNPRLSVRFLVRIEDVTDKVLNSYRANMSEEERIKIVADNSRAIEANAIENTHYSARVEQFYYGNQYFLFVYESYTDVRLVGAPPSSIGKFGGDTDNWMWPRHTGDFSLFRIYADKDNKPADYSKENVPYKPKKSLVISTKGVNEGDFTMVYGYPGRTQEYLHSAAISYVEMSNPHKIAMRTLRLNIQSEEMNKSQAVRIQYASKNSGVSNAWKRWQGETLGLKKKRVVDSKIAFEKRFASWAVNKPEYNGLLDRLAKLYKEQESFSYANDFHAEAIASNEIIRLSSTIISTIERNSRMTPVVSANNIKAVLEPFYKDYYMPIDKKSFVALLDYYDKYAIESFKPQLFKEWLSKYGSVSGMADYVFDNSILVSKEKAMKALENGVDEAAFRNDPAYIFFTAFNDILTNDITPRLREINTELTLLYRTYMRGQMELQKDVVFYPDANSTLRITYGKVNGYAPADAVYYLPVSTLTGVMQKDNPEIYDYDIPQKLRDIYANKDFGKWESNGTVPVCFIASNHTSGGNSGSPVLNDKGELIGVNFDRVWEGTMSDLAYDPEICRNISLDIRYALFVIDKVAGATHLLDEMKFAN